MKFYESLTERRENESYDKWYERDYAAKKAKEQWGQMQPMNQALRIPGAPEPDWNAWNPIPLVRPPSPSRPPDPAHEIAQFNFPDIKPWVPQPIPPAESPDDFLTILSKSVVDDDVPIWTSVAYLDGTVETLGLSPKQVWKAVKVTAKTVWKGAKKLPGPIGTGYKMYQAAKAFYELDKALLPPSTESPGMPEVRYDHNQNMFLWEHPGGYWRPFPPPHS